jgi:hypothetical protein
MEMKLVSVDTSSRYDVAPADVSQLAVKDVCPMLRAGVATGAGGVATTVVTTILLEAPLGPPALLALSRK